jgi:hypothetical protein
MIRLGLFALVSIALVCGCHHDSAAVVDAGNEESPEAKAAREAHETAVALSASAARADRSADLVVQAAHAPAGQSLASDVGEPVYLALDDANVYWADAQQGFVVGGAKAGGAGHVIARDNTFSPASRARVIAADADAVYWVGVRVHGASRESGVFKAEKSGKPAELAAAQDEPYELVLGDDTVYWLERPRAGEAAGSATLHAVPKVGGAPRTLGNLGRACALSVDAKSIAWLEVAPKPALRRATLEGESLATLAPANGAACSLAADERNYYWPRPDLDQVLAAPKAGGSPRVLSLVGRKPTQVAIANGALLVATEHGPDGKGDGVIYSLPTSTGLAKPIARAIHLTSLAFDGTYPYWTSFVGDGGGGGVFRGPKL